ncbi:MAG: Photosystem I assembly protein Ycf3 [Nitrospirae bacterium]|nr:MAG: TPR-domain containing protein [Nitrospira sp. OLB3]MBV6471627.1 Photosystem I assembly protein Ycf3 [Nitrospirota bacterium]MCK6493868.1 tetratricopeptide repeat protein [Nitrospira sp.]MEB2338689.1 tetratricopeptide repeat protein [Nitrospirales bacterium]QOJ34703.1 MAG: tetratricopeptide repeat protein [Nitrospira sp.]
MSPQPLVLAGWLPLILAAVLFQPAPVTAQESTVPAPSTEAASQAPSAPEESPAAAESPTPPPPPPSPTQTEEAEAVRVEPLPAESASPPPPPPPPALTLLETLSQTRKTVHTEPDAQEPRLALGRTLFQLGDTDAAIDEFRTALRFHPSVAQAHMDLGTALMAKQDWRNAMTEFQEAVRLDATLVQAHYSMGTIHYTRGNVAQAIKAYQEALKLKPDFAEAHYRLGLVLKMAGKEKEAAQELETAALAGIAKAQYFLGNAYRSGQGADKNLTMAVTWWSRAFDQGLPEAAQALTQLRRIAVVKGNLQTKQSKAAAEAFKEYCDQIWLDFPDLDRAQTPETVGTTLLRQGRTAEALPVLLREAYALNDSAHATLVRLYEQGLDDQLPPHGQWIMSYLESTAADGSVASRTALARIYAKGLGLAADLAKAKSYLKGLPRDEVKRILDEAAPDAPKP